MIDFLIDIGVVLLFLAVIGFLATEAYNFGAYRGLLRNNTSIGNLQFQYVAIALWIICPLIMFTIMALATPGDNPFKTVLMAIFDLYYKLELAGYLSPGLTVSFMTVIFALFIPATLYFFSFFIIMVYGIFVRHTNVLWVNVTFKDSTPPKDYAHVIYQDSNFMYFENEEGDFWDGIAKDNIAKIKLIKHAPKYTNKVATMKKTWKEDKQLFIRDNMVLTLFGAYFILIVLAIVVSAWI
jgi:hypothetical protein